MNIVSSDGSIRVNPLSLCDYDLSVVDLGNDIITADSSSIILRGVGTLNSKLIGSIKLSTNPTNQLQIDSSGLLVLPQRVDGSDETVKVSNGDAVAGYLNGKIIQGDNILITVESVGGNQKLKITGNASKAISTESTPTINIFGDGSDGAVLYAAVRISATTGNTLIANSDGLFVPKKINGTINKLAKFDTTSSIGDSQLIDDGTGVGIGTSPETNYRLKVQNNLKVVGQIITTPQTLTYASTTVWNMNQGENAILTLTGNSTLSITNAVAGSFGIIEVRQDGTGSRTLTLPTGSTVGGNGLGVINLTTTANAVDILGFFYNGTSFRWRKDLKHT